MKLQRIGLTALFTLLTTLSFGDFPVISNSQSKSLNGVALAQTPEAKKAEADRLLQQGNQQLNSNQFEAALQPLQQALVIYQEIKDRQGEGWVLGNLGVAYLNLGDYQRAIQYSEQWLAIAKEIKDRQNEGIALGNLGVAYLNLGNYQRAIEYFQQVLAIAREIKNRQGERWALGNLLLAYFNLDDLSRMIEYSQQTLAIEYFKQPSVIKYFQQQLTLARENKDRQTEVIALRNLGYVYFFNSDYSQVIKYFEQALTLAREIKDRQTEVIALRNLGLAYKQNTYSDDYRRSIKRAIEYFEAALALAREIKARTNELLILYSLVDAYRLLGDYPQANKYSEQLLVFAREIKDRRVEAWALRYLGIGYFYLDDLRGTQYWEQSLAIAKKIKDREMEGQMLREMSQTYGSSYSYPRAIDSLQQQLATSREIKDRKSEGTALANLGLAYLSLGDYSRAIEYYEQLLALAREIKDRESEGTALGNLGFAYLSLGDYSRAINYSEQWLASAREIKDRRSEGQALTNLGAAYLNLGDSLQAIKHFLQSLAIASEIEDGEGVRQALASLGVAYFNLGYYPLAIEYFKQQLALAKRIEMKDLKNEGNALNNLGLALFKSGNLAAAETNLTKAIEVYESLRGGLKDSEKISIFEIQSSPYFNLQQVLVAQNKTDSALEISERGRARAFVELLAQRLSPNSQKTSPETTLKPTITQIRQIAKAQNATLVQYSITYDYFQIQGKQELKESELYIWVIKPTGEVIFRKADLKPLWQQKNTTLDNLVTKSRESIGARGRATVEIVLKPSPDQSERLQQLHEILIEPISDLLPTDPNSRVIFVPQSSLFLVPFPALKDKSGKYLIEKHTILTAPSIQVLELTRQQKQKSRTTGEALVVGNPIMPTVSLDPGKPPQQLIPLPGAEREAIAIAPLLKTQAITGSFGTKANVVQRMSTARIIHLATHGLLDDFRGLGSAIALTPSGNDNGLLTAEEILDLKLSADLVVLSACDTGRGRITGDGVVGLSRAFISAGVPSVIVSLWAVPDAPTAQLMTAFYENLQTNPDKAQALRQAMLTMMKTYPNPKDWAAFTLIGEAE